MTLCTIENLELHVQDHAIRSTNSLRLLSITIDAQLKFDKDISNICITSSRKVGVLMRLRNLIPVQTKFHLYITAILPHLTFCHVIWHFVEPVTQGN